MVMSVRAIQFCESNTNFQSSFYNLRILSFVFTHHEFVSARRQLQLFLILFIYFYSLLYLTLSLKKKKKEEEDKEKKSFSSPKKVVYP